MAKVQAFITVFLITAPVLVQARLGSFGGKSSVREVVEAQGSLQREEMPPDSPDNEIVVKLDRVNSKKQIDSKGGFYIGKIGIGNPAKDLTVMFHTLSGHVMVPHVACHMPACNEHTTYSPWASQTAWDVNLNGTAVTQGHRFALGDVKRQAVVLGYKDSALGEGEAKSLLVRDHICVKSEKGGQGCVDLEILAATSLPDTPFRSMPNDGIVGLGFESMAAGPLCSFFGQYVKNSKNMLPQFAFTLGDIGGELHIGGHDESRFYPPLKWHEIEGPEEGFWKIAIKSVRVGNRIIDACEQGCHGYIDSGASLLGVRASNLDSFKAELESHIDEEGCQGSELIFDLGGETTLALPPDDYTDADCVPQLGPLNAEENSLPGIYALGAPMMRHYYTAFDWDSKRIGFARSTGVLPKEKKNFLGLF